MPKMISFVFKVLIMTVLIAMFVSLAACIIDIFVTTSRIQSLAQMVQFDVAQNNCLLNDTYEGFKGELYDISNRSRYMKVCFNGDNPTGYSADVRANTLLNSNPAMQLYRNDQDASQYYIQKQPSDKGVLAPTVGSSAPGAKEFYVANYGDILELGINTVVNPRMWGISTADGSPSISDFSQFALNGKGGSKLTLRFTIPALTYIK